ncbi:MAG: hypothetical protein HC893_08145 [Chloroflexaceae bacterium]|nr:hypothetical protein [Chloroflexaceae bacterium]
MRGGQVTIAEDSVLFIVPATADTSALPPEIRSDVRDQAVILAQIQDSTGSPVPAYPVVVTTSLGRFANAAQVITVDSNAEGGILVPLYGVPQAGTARVFVQAGQATGNTQVTLAAGQCEDFEDNDTPVQANDQPSALCRGSFEDDVIINPEEGEDDYYSLVLEPGDALTVELREIPAGADYDIILYNTALEVVAFSNQNGQANERFTYTNAGTQPALFYVRVNMIGKSTMVENSYLLRVAREPLEAPGALANRLQSLPSSEHTTADPVLPAKP